MRKIHDQYDGKSIAYIDSEGRAVTADDDTFDTTLAYYEQMGLNSDLIHMARPLFDGDERQQALASQFLMKVKNRYMDRETAQWQLIELLKDEGMHMGRVPHVSEADFNKAWDESGSPGGSKGAANYSFGHSDLIRKQVLRQGHNPDV